MIKLPRFDSIFDKAPQNEFVRDLLKALGFVPDTSIYIIESTAWAPPIKMQVPLYKGAQPRAVSPDIVRCARATTLNDKKTPVHFGATIWEWFGNNQISITDVDGLVAGDTYRLVFEVIG